MQRKPPASCPMVNEEALSGDAVVRIRCLISYLRSRGHPDGTVRCYARSVAHFERWLADERKTINERSASHFTNDHLRACACSPPVVTHRKTVHAALNHFLVALRSAGLVTPCEPPQLSSVEVELRSYDAHLLGVCGLSSNTRIYRLRYAREFLAHCLGGRVDRAAGLQPEQLEDFIIARAAGCCRGPAKVICAAIRSYLKYLFLRGDVSRRIVEAVPTIPQWRLSSVPRSLDKEQVDRLLAVFDTSTSAGLRDHAMVLCMATLGLRTSEVAGLSLGDFDWRNGIVRISTGKSRHARVLPLPEELGEAISRYLRAGRPASSEPAVFLRHTVPVGLRVTYHIVRSVVRYALAKAGINPPMPGPHLLRHTLATQMVRNGARLTEVAGVLGHASIDTTAIYAKVDMPLLSRVVVPWPRGAL